MGTHNFVCGSHTRTQEAIPAADSGGQQRIMVAAEPYTSVYNIWRG